jgi:hypothetical protein
MLPSDVSCPAIPTEICTTILHSFTLEQWPRILPQLNAALQVPHTLVRRCLAQSLVSHAILFQVLAISRRILTHLRTAQQVTHSLVLHANSFYLGYLPQLQTTLTHTPTLASGAEHQLRGSDSAASRT